jgi:thiol-disulfide isomerase/thioredoxin
MNRFVRTIATAGLLGMLLLGCAKPKKAETEQRIYTMEEAAEMQRQANATKPSFNPPPQGSGQTHQPKHKVGSAAPETVSQELGGKEVKLSDLKGKVVVLDFWATWCGPCRAMIPHTTQLFEKMKGKPVVIVSISGDAQKETLTEFLKTNKMPWTHWWDGKGALSRIYGVTAIPTVYVIDHKGIIRHHQVGGGHEMDSAIEKLVKEAEDSTKDPTKAETE